MDKPIEYIHYAPYGELLAIEHNGNYREKYLFTGKERDEETGLDYFGARYYDSRLGFWTSVDPLADKYPNVTPYLYCNGNPVMMVDLDGREPTDEEAAAMAAYAYGDAAPEEEKRINEQLGAWEPINTHDSQLTGYRGVLFQREIDGGKEYAYAFAGTDPKSVADIATDIAQTVDLPSQYEIAVVIARGLAIKYRDSELTFVGHSLGGGEAKAAALATGKTAVTFNSAELSLSTMVRNLLIVPAKIKNHIVDGDPLTRVQTYGNPILVGLLHRSGLVFLPGERTIVPQVADNAHSIYNFIK